MNEIQIIWTAACIGLVFFMQAGFACLEAGTVRAKNTVNVLMKNYVDLCVGSVIFWAFGYGLMFGDNPTGLIGTSHFMPSSFTAEEAIRLAYQTMFATTAATIVSGAMAERMRFSAYLLYSVFVSAILYPVFGSWVWNSDGWLAKLGFIDFAGGSVVHSIGAWCALAGIIVLKPRLGKFAKNGEPRDIPGHNLSLVTLGGFILWFGWIGFNGGSIAFGKDNLGLVIINTHIGGCAAVITSLLYMYMRKQKILLTTTINASLAGLVSVTAGAAYYTPSSAIIVAAIGSLLFMFGIKMLEGMKLDDSVGAFPVHGICGIWGTMAVALFMTDGDPKANHFFAQFIGVTACFLWAFPISFIFFKVINRMVGVRVDPVDEQRGLDYTEHHELGYPEFQKRLDSEA